MALNLPDILLGTVRAHRFTLNVLGDLSVRFPLLVTSYVSV